MHKLPCFCTKRGKVALSCALSATLPPNREGQQQTIDDFGTCLQDLHGWAHVTQVACLVE